MSLNLWMFMVFMFLGGGVLNAILTGTTGIATTVLTSDMTSTATSMNVDSTTAFNPQNDVVIIDDETICYASVTATTFAGLTRGPSCRKGTSAGAHSATTGGVANRVYSETPGIVNVLIGFNIASAFSEGGIIGALKGVVTTMSNLPNFLNAAAKMVLWDYDFLSGSYVWLRYVLLSTLSAGMVMAFIRMALGR